MSGPPPIIEYRVIRSDGIPVSWSAVDESQLRRDWKEKGWTIQSIEIYAEWEAEMNRIDAEQEYHHELEQAAEVA